MTEQLSHSAQRGQFKSGRKHIIYKYRSLALNPFYQSDWCEGILNSHLVDSWGKGYRCLYFQLLNFHWYLYVLHRHTDLDQITNMLDTTEQKDLWTLPEWYWISGFGRKLLRGCQQAVKKSEQWAAFPRGAQTSFLFWSIWAGGSPTFYEVDF